MSASSDAQMVVVSFYGGEDRYREAADVLRADCERLGLDHDIVDLSAEDSRRGWVEWCREKVPFCLRMLRKHQRPIFWLDVDCRLAKRIDVLDGATCDFGAFLRGRRYLRDFDPLSAPRFFSPFALYFNATPRARAFLELMADLESRYEGSATDDFFLQEAWKQHQQQLSVMVLPPELVGEEWPLTGDQCIYFGRSGNASRFKSQAEQHVAPIYASAHRQAVLMREAANALDAGQTGDALVLFRRALAIEPQDALAERIGRLLRRAGRHAEAEEFLRRYREGALADDSVDRLPDPIWKRWLSSRRPG